MLFFLFVDSLSDSSMSESAGCFDIDGLLLNFGGVRMLLGRDKAFEICELVLSFLECLLSCLLDLCPSLKLLLELLLLSCDFLCLLMFLKSDGDTDDTLFNDVRLVFSLSSFDNCRAKYFLHSADDIVSGCLHFKAILVSSLLYEAECDLGDFLRELSFDLLDFVASFDRNLESDDFDIFFSLLRPLKLLLLDIFLLGLDDIALSLYLNGESFSLTDVALSLNDGLRLNPLDRLPCGDSLPLFR